MIPPLAPAGMSPGAAPAESAGDRKLRDAARQLEGLFVQELFKAMRATVPQGEGIVSGGAGEDMFTSLFDQHVAAAAPSRWERGLADALYRQLRGVGPVLAPAAGADPVAAASPPAPVVLPDAAPR